MNRNPRARDGRDMNATRTPARTDDAAWRCRAGLAGVCRATTDRNEGDRA